MTRPSVPNPVKRVLRQEAGFGCCKCGHPIYDYQHIVPYSSERHFRVEDMMLLCPNHHREATVGAMTQAEQRRYKADPYNRRHGTAEGLLSVSQSALAVQLGSNEFVGNGTVLEVDDVPLLRLYRGEGGTLELSVPLYSRDGKLLALIERNKWIIGDPLPWDFEFGIRWMTVRERSGLISLTIDARKFPTLIHGQLWYKGCFFKIGKDELSMNREHQDVYIIQFSHLCFVSQQLQIGTDGESVSWGPTEEFGEGVIVSEPDRLKRVLDGIESWQHLKYPH